MCVLILGAKASIFGITGLNSNSLVHIFTAKSALPKMFKNSTDDKRV